MKLIRSYAAKKQLVQAIPAERTKRSLMRRYCGFQESEPHPLKPNWTSLPRLRTKERPRMLDTRAMST